MRMQIYFNDQESDYVKTKKRGFMRSLIQKQMEDEGVLFEKLEKTIEESNDRKCRVCGGLLDKFSKCSNKDCKKFLK